MNDRRSFFKQLALGVASFAILPSAATYERIWKPKAIVPVRYEINLKWVNAPFEVNFHWKTAGVMEKEGLILKRKPGEPSLTEGDPFPPRFYLEHGKFIHVPAYVEVGPMI